MRKLLCTLLFLAVMLACGTPSVASAEIDQNSASKVGSTTLTYSVAEPTYTVTIPATAELDTEFDVKAENVTNVHETQHLTVKVTEWTKASSGDGFALEGGGIYIPCTVTAGQNGDAFVLGDAVLDVAGGETTKSSKMHITKSDANGVYAPGTYTGTMTFTIAVEDIEGYASEATDTATTLDELTSAMSADAGDVNYIKLGSDISAASNIELTAASKPMVLDFDGHTINFTGSSMMMLGETATLKNGTIKAEAVALFLTAGNITLDNMTVISEGQSAVENLSANTIITNSNLSGLLGIYVNSGSASASDVTLSGFESAYGSVSGSTFILDGNDVSGTMSQDKAYTSPGRS